ncbi:MAG: CdaR family protein [Anaerolineaceae bacterium]|jgi:YbbR domain-containing protein
MMNLLRRFLKNLPTLLTAFVLALMVWIIAVSSTDPVVVQAVPTSIPIQVIGKDSTLLVTNSIPTDLTLTLSAPRSVWSQLTNSPNLVRAFIDLSGLEAGQHEVPVQVQVGITPVRVKSYTPQTATVVLQQFASQAFIIKVAQTGTQPVGFQLSDPVLDPTTATVSGPAPQVDQVSEVRATIDVGGIMQDTTQTVTLQALDASGKIVSGVSLTPQQVSVTLPVTRMPGYRVVVVSVVVSGQVADGYRLSGITVNPPVVTLHSDQASLVDALPGFIQTQTLNVNNANQNIDASLSLSLPEGVTVEGSNTVQVHVGVVALVGSLTMSQVPVETVGLDPGLQALMSPQAVDVILSGSTPQLNQLTRSMVTVTLDLSGLGPGVYQKEPKIAISIPGLNVDTVLPATVEVTISEAPTLTPTPVR